MKATELRIGNYYYGCSRKQLEIVTGQTIAQRESGELPCMKGVPLTEEWLLKFGFEKIGTYFKINNEFEILTDNGRYYYYINLDRLYLNSIHQLQNLYFALTGEELILNI